MKHPREYWDIVALDSIKKAKGFDKSFTRNPNDWRWIWRQKFLSLLRQQAEYINPNMARMRQAGWH